MQNYTNNFVLRANEQRKSGKMETLKEKEWLFINDLIKKLYEQKNMQDLGDTFLLSIRKLIKYKAAVFTVVSSDFTVVMDKSIFSSEILQFR